MYELTIKRSARKELDSLADELFLKIDRAILSLKETRSRIRSPRNSKAKINEGFA